MTCEPLAGGVEVTETTGSRLAESDGEAETPDRDWLLPEAETSAEDAPLTALPSLDEAEAVAEAEAGMETSPELDATEDPLGLAEAVTDTSGVPLPLCDGCCVALAEGVAFTEDGSCAGALLVEASGTGTTPWLNVLADADGASEEVT
jgi:hypothetical protein